MLEVGREEMSGRGGYRRRALDERGHKLIPVLAPTRPVVMDSMKIRAYRIACHLLLHLSRADIKDKSDLVGVVSRYATEKGLFFGPPPRHAARGVSTLSSTPIKVFDFGNTVCVVLVEVIAGNIIGIKAFERRKASGVKEQTDELWYPMGKDA